jgi:hypothetical protein
VLINVAAQPTSRHFRVESYDHAVSVSRHDALAPNWLSGLCEEYESLQCADGLPKGCTIEECDVCRACGW